MDNLLFLIFFMALPIIVVEFAIKGLTFCLDKLFNKKYLNYQTAFGLFFVVFYNPVIFVYLNRAINWLFCATILPNPQQTCYWLGLILISLQLIFAGILIIIGLISSKFQKKISTSLYIFVNAFLAFCLVIVSSGWGLWGIYNLYDVWGRPGNLSPGVGAVLIFYITPPAIFISFVVALALFICLWEKSGNTNHSVSLRND